jgi:glycosyltransferase involved in cell wall biosynthesis
LRIGLIGFGAPGATGGVQVYARELARALPHHDRSGNRYVLLVSGPDERVGLEGLEVVRLEPGEAARGRWRRRAAKLARLAGWNAGWGDAVSSQVDRLGLDLVHHPATRIAEFSLATPLVLTFFDMQEEFLPASFSWRERIGRKADHRAGVRKAAVVIVPSRFTARAVEGVYGANPRKIQVIPVGVGDRFDPTAAPGERERLQSRYGLGGEPFLFYPANPWPHKNHAALLRALTTMGSSTPMLVCAGRLREEPRTVAALAAQAGLSPSQVRDLGFVPEEDMPALYRAARAVVFPSLFEGFGMPVLEAMACGCPVACSNAASLPEVAGDAARLFDPRDQAAMAEAIGEVWADEALQARLVERGHARAAEHRWPRVVPLLLEAYERAAGSGSPSARSNSSGSGSVGQHSQGPQASRSSTE